MTTGIPLQESMGGFLPAGSPDTLQEMTKHDKT